ncbi:MAG: sulfatase-like hydrolase/transferase, partial [Acidobacteriota bacterium]
MSAAGRRASSSERPGGAIALGLALAVVIAAYGSLVSCARGPDLGRARQWIEQGRPDLAVAALRDAEPKSAEAWQLLAAAYTRLPERAEEAAEVMAPVATTGPPMLTLAAARFAQAADRVGDAARWLEQARERHPRDVELAIEQAKLLTQLGRAEQAVAELEPLVSGDPRLLNVVGYAALLAGDSQRAQAFLERSVERAAERGVNYAPAHYHLGLLWLARGDELRARSALRRAAEGNPKHLEAFYQALGIAERRGDARDAEQARERLAALNRQRLAALGALDEPPAPVTPPAVERWVAIEQRGLEEDAPLRRRIPAGSSVEFACRVPASGAVRFRVSVTAGPGTGSRLLDVIHAPDPRGERWEPHVVELPGAPGGEGESIESEISFELLAASRWRRWLGWLVGPDTRSAAFSEPVRVGPVVGRSRDPRPNVLLISLDTLRADRLGSYGHPRATSPTLDRLAASGVRFSRAEAPSNWTLPSHYSMLSGLTPAAHGVLPDLAQVRGYLFPDRRLAVRGSGRETMLAELLAEAGYRTAAVTENGWVSARFGLDQGFQMYRSDLRGALPGTLEASLAELRLTGRRGPWFLFVHTYTTHQPYHAPKPLRTRFADREHVGLAWPAARVPISDYNRFKVDLFPPTTSDIRAFSDLYDGQVAWADTLVGDLVGWLEQVGLLEQTIVIVTSDHGEEIFERGQFDHGDTLYEEVTRVPLIVYAPGRIGEGLVVSQPVSLVDLPATVLDLVGLGTELGQGSSLRPLWEGRVEGHHPVMAEAIDLDSRPLVAVWDGALKYIRRGEGERAREELYDLTRDPAERRDLSR